VACVFSLGVVEMSSLGFLATISFASIASTKWGTHEAEQVEDVISILWRYIQVPLFGLIGAAIYVADLKGSDVGFAFIIITVAVSFRIPAAFTAMYGTNLNKKEKIFVAIAWMPKATVQAALGGVVLGIAEKEDLGSDFERYGL
jgi:NhaP-type Na+/H+ or K+/H+ antiporter